jgi:hypothetical protein
MLVRGVGIRDISAILSVSVNKVLKTLAATVYVIKVLSLNNISLTKSDKSTGKHE